MKNFYLLFVIPIFFLANTKIFSQNCLTIWSSTEMVLNGDTAQLDIKVKDFENIIGMQYTMTFDPQQLEFVSVENFNLPSLTGGNFGYMTDEGHLTLSWLDNAVSGVDMPDNAVIYSIKFKVLHPNGTSSSLSFEGDPTPIEVVQLTSDGDLSVSPTFIDGQIFATTNAIDYPVIESICSTNSGCPDMDLGSVDLTVSGGSPPYTYVWTYESGTNYTTEDLNDVALGTYEITVTDQNANQATGLIVVLSENLFPFSVEAVLFNSSCVGGDIGAIELTTSGGSGNYTYIWNTGDTEANLYNLAPGNYEVTITDTNSGCTITENYTIDQATGFDLEINKNNPSCGFDNGSIELLVASPGDFTFQWSTGESTSSLTNIGAGSYDVTITETNSGCQDVETIHLIIEDFIPGTTYQCQFFDNNMVVVSPTIVVWSGGQPPYTFSWSDGTIDTDTLLSTINVSTLTTAPQIFTVTVTDANGCTFQPVTIEADCNNSSEEVEIYTPPTAVDVGESFCVDVNVSNFTDILSMQFSTNWDPTLLQFDSISNYILPNGSSTNFGTPDILGPGVLTFAWLDNATMGVSLPDDSAIFQLCFTSLAEGNTNIDFTGTPTPIEIIDINLDELQLNSGNNPITISGDVGSFDFNIEQPTCGQSNGSIEIDVLEPGDYTFAWNTGATTSTISGLPAGSYEVTITNNDTGDSSVYPIELTETDFLTGQSVECQFLPDDSVNINMHLAVWSGGLPPYTFNWSNGYTQTDEFYSTLSVTAHLNDALSYMVTITDATGCIFEPVFVEPVCVGSNEIILSATEEEAEVGETVCLDITTSGFTDIASLQFSMDWDASKLQFESIQGFGLPGMSSNNFNDESELADGVLRFSWLDNATTGHTLSDNSVLFQLCLTAVADGGVIPVNFSDSPVTQEAINGDLQSLNITNNHGSVTLSPNNFDGVGVSIGSEVGLPGQEVCLPVTCQDFTDIASMQFSIVWDPSIIEYSNIVLGDLPSLSLSNFGLLGVNDGEIRLSWLDQATAGVSLPDNTTLFEICFTPTGTPGVSPVGFSNNPIPIEFISSGATEVGFNVNDGEVVVPTNLVWPGDTDISEAVNHFDLLNIGLAFGSSGPARDDSSIDWEAQYSEDWGSITPNTAINFKHADTDGNGIVDANDTLAIIQNWGEVTEFWDGDEENRFNDPDEALNNTPIYVLPDTIVPGETVDFSIILGNTESPANDIYGLAFSIIYDPEVIVENSVSAQFMESWLGDVNTNLLGIYRDSYGNNRIDIAITRTDLNNVSGQGMIGSLKVTIEDVIFLRSEAYEMHFEIENVRMIDAQEQEIPVSPLDTEVLILEETTHTNEPEWASHILLYPVPAKNQLYWNAGTLLVERLQLYSIEGKLLRQFDPKDNTMNISHLPEGAYLLQIVTDKGVVVRRIEKL